MKDLEERSIANLVNEKQNLSNVYKNCKEMFGTNISEHGETALAKISDAISSIESEIQRKVSVLYNPHTSTDAT